MASSKVSNSVNSDLSLHHHHHHNHNQPSSSPMIADFSPSSPMILRHNSTPTILDTGIMSRQNSSTDRKTAEEVWREIVGERRECKFEPPDEMMTLEDFLAKAEEVEVEDDDEFHDYKQTPPSLAAEDRLGSSGLFGFDPLIRSQSESQYLPTSRVVEGGGVGVGGRGKRRGGSILETMDKATQQRQRRMIKNRESAARSRERKQAYQFELESLAMKLEEENEKLLREKAEFTKQRYKQLMEKLVPVVEKRKPPRTLRRVRSMQW